MELNRTEAAAALGIDPTTLDAWTRKGCPIVEKNGRGVSSRYRLSDIMAWRIETELARVMGKADASGDDLDALRARKLEIENERRALELAKIRGELVEAAEVSRVIKSIVMGGKAHLLAVAPSRIAAAVNGGESARTAAHREIHNALIQWNEIGLDQALAKTGAKVATNEP